MVEIYRKTSKGTAEMVGTTRQLTPKQRRVLILVDGKRDIEALRALGPDTDTILEQLLADGYIEPLAGAESPGIPISSPQGDRASSERPVASSEPATNTFAALRAQAVRELIELVGPMGESLALRMEKAVEPQQFKPLVALAITIILNVRGAKVAEAYGQKYQV
ncbi:hypothetical protein LCC91_00255 [Tepidimonas taiwanensis]|nr:hypothetical protein [Tepidimonas taiwanensis]MCX7692379.1 hypothetical protein [Tepidimonas taiwanensis]MDM7462715.1 hypothetical protein [Tepidimonas taiwanensis]UBQ05603.1 hypothetical protein LCC91_00255 [Tepidimonas taiwanensis]